MRTEEGSIRSDSVPRGDLVPLGDLVPSGGLVPSGALGPFGDLVPCRAAQEGKRAAASPSIGSPGKRPMRAQEGST